MSSVQQYNQIIIIIYRRSMELEIVSDHSNDLQWVFKKLHIWLYFVEIKEIPDCPGDQGVKTVFRIISKGFEQSIHYSSTVSANFLNSGSKANFLTFDCCKKLCGIGIRQYLLYMV